MTILTIEKTVLEICDNFDNWKDSPGDLWHLRHWLQLRTWIHGNHCYLTINCDTGQHSQFLQCLQNSIKNILIFHFFDKIQFIKCIKNVGILEKVGWRNLYRAPCGFLAAQLLCQRDSMNNIPGVQQHIKLDSY